jgi:dihydrofolate reductase
MAKLSAFNNISLDGYFSGKNGELAWAKSHMDPEFNAFVASNAQMGGTLVFGRITYELMAGYWPTGQATKADPVVAERMNNLPKIVFSRTLSSVSWANTRLVQTDPATEIRKLKSSSADDMVILGSGSIVSQLAQAKLIDEFQVVVNPIILAEGRTMFEGVKHSLSLKMTRNRIFASGNAFLCYEPAAKGASHGRTIGNS